MHADLLFISPRHAWIEVLAVEFLEERGLYCCAQAAPSLADEWCRYDSGGSLAEQVQLGGAHLLQ